MNCLSNNKVCAQSTNNFYRIFFGVQKNNQDSSCDHCAKVGTVNKDPGVTFESQVRRSHQFVAFGRLFPVELHRARSERADATSRSLRSAVIECSLAMVAWCNEQSKWYTTTREQQLDSTEKVEESWNGTVEDTWNVSGRGSLAWLQNPHGQERGGVPVRKLNRF